MLDDGRRLYLATSALVLAIFRCYRKYRVKQSGPPLPPGHTLLPILGNVLSLGVARPWATFNAWGLKSTYGDIIYAHLLNKPVIVINSEESIVYEHSGSDFNTSPLPYGGAFIDEFTIRHFVKLKHPLTTLYNCVAPTKRCSVFYRTLVNIQGILRRLALPLYFHIMERCADWVLAALTPGAVVLEAFSFFLKLPNWFPGPTFKRASLECIKAAHDIKEIPFQFVKERMTTGITAPCLLTDDLNKPGHLYDAVITTAVKEAACITFAGAFETATSTLLVFILAMMLNPEVKAKVQAEID
ncbi:cytochrome P450 [Suillus variegatus]|nr:cytochrome P450 [Suillus variegatus]